MQRTRAGIGSVEIGIRILRVLAESPVPLPLKAIAAAADMPAPKAHKYLVSYIQGGLVRQDHAGGPYDLGCLALELGLAAMRRLDVVSLAQPYLDDVREQVGMTVALAVWANYGPAIVRRADSPGIGVSQIRLGTVLPLLSSAIGLVFATYLDRRFMMPLLRKELEDPRGLASQAGIYDLTIADTRLARVRETGRAFAEGVVDPGRSAAAAPVFDHTGNLAAAMSVIGIQGQLLDDPRSLPVQALLAAAMELSKQLGASLRRR